METMATRQIHITVSCVILGKVPRLYHRLFIENKSNSNAHRLGFLFAEKRFSMECETKAK